MRRRPALAALLAVAVACGPGGGAGERASPPADTAGPDRAPAAPVDVPPRDPAGPLPADSIPVGAPDARSPSLGTWTAGIVDLEPVGDGVPIQRAIRAARHEGYDRIVLEFSGGRPGIHVEYVDEPVRECGSGRPVTLPGDGWLEVRLQMAAAHVDGESTLDRRRFAPGLPAVRELVLTCDFEGVVTWVAAVDAPEPYRVLALEDPIRIVVDVRHPEP